MRVGSSWWRRGALVLVLSVATVSAGVSGAGAGQASAAAAPVVSRGWNDWACRPSPAHPEAVVLAHGLGANGVDNFVTLAPTLVAAGYCVFSTTYGQTILGDLVGGLGPMQDSAATLSRFVDRVLATTGTTKVDIVGHSEGTTVPAYYMRFLGGAAKVDHFVGFGANYRGTSLSGLGTLGKALHLQPLLDGVGCPACSQYLPGSNFLTRLDAGGVFTPGPDYTNIVTRYDLVVTPYTSGVVAGPGVTNIVLQDSCPLDFSGHVGLAVDPNVASLVRYRLDPTHAPRPTCVPFWALGA